MLRGMLRMIPNRLSGGPTGPLSFYQYGFFFPAAVTGFFLFCVSFFCIVFVSSFRRSVVLYFKMISLLQKQG